MQDSEMSFARLFLCPSERESFFFVDFMIFYRFIYRYLAEKYVYLQVM